VLKFTPGPAPHLSKRFIRRIATRESVEIGDRHPTLIQDVEGPHLELDLLSSEDLVFDWRWAYLIAVHGQFRLRAGDRASRGSRPHASVITIILAAKTGAIEDFGISDRYPDLGKVGLVRTDYQQ
jgi:hypothetical protein